MKQKMKKLIRYGICLVMAVIMAVSGSVMAATYTFEKMETSDPYSGKTIKRIVLGGEAETIAPNSITKLNASNANNSDVMGERLVAYMPPLLKETEMDLYAVIDNTGSGQAKDDFMNAKIKAEDETITTTDGRVVKRYYVLQKELDKAPSTVSAGTLVGKAKVIERDADGNFILAKDDNGKIIRSTATGDILAEATWKNYIFVAVSFMDLPSIPYQRAVVVYDLNNLDEPCAVWNLDDLDLLTNLYDVNMSYLKSNMTVGNNNYLTTNYYRQRLINGIYVDDDNIIIGYAKRRMDVLTGNDTQMNEIGVYQFENPLAQGKTELGKKISEQVTEKQTYIVDQGENRGNYFADPYNTVRMAKIKNTLILMHLRSKQYLTIDMSSGAMAASVVNKGLPAMIMAEAGGTSISFSDFDLEGTMMYLTGKINTGEAVISKFDLTNPTEPKLIYCFKQSGLGAKGFVSPQFTMDGGTGILYDKGSFRGQDSNTWMITLDVSRRDKGIKEIAAFENEPLYSWHAGFGGGKRKDISLYGDYAFIVAGGYYSSYRNVIITEFNAERDNIITADDMRMLINVDKGSHVGGYEFSFSRNYEGKILSFYVKPSGGEPVQSGAIFSVMTPINMNEYSSSMNTPIFNDDGSVTLSGTIAHTPMGRFSSYTENLYIDINNKRLEITDWDREGNGEWEYTIKNIRQGELYAVKIYGNIVFNDQERDENDNWVIVKKEDLLDKYYDYTEFVIGTRVFDIDAYTFDEANKKIIVDYSLSEGEEKITGTPILALYKDDKLVNVNYGTEEVTLSSSKGLNAEITVPSDWTTITGGAVRLFIWDSETIEPLANDVLKELD